MGKPVDIVTILGHTAAGKTRLAAHLACRLKAEIVSADSRQVYRQMNIGTGKDYSDYIVNGIQVPYHLIDIADAGEEYSVYEFQKDFFSVYANLKNEGKSIVLCGGTGLYLESVLRQYNLLKVPFNKALREELEGKELEEIIAILKSYKSLHNITDTQTRKRAIRAVEIAEYYHSHGVDDTQSEEIRSLTIGVYYEREHRRQRITQRLQQRLQEGLIAEVENLLRSGVSHDKLEYYGLEYKFLSRYLRGDLSYDEMFNRLNTAIHQFAKRQMTYFRGMERRGIPVHWIRGELQMEEKINQIINLWQAT